MTVHKDIASFIDLLNKEPKVFQPTAWQDLPQLNTDILKLADNESAIAETIKTWCIKHDLGKILRDGTRKEIEDVGEPTPTTMQPLTNITQTLRTSIEESYKKLQAAAENQSDTSNDSK
ncbi:hypothetical protein QT970_26710 [Microcoleus sp. herbarium8]|uniref:hypothetical protein n=1 Tax=Microcoleus sp. herbarium8 TaxID=3055436 RepID=UPI002FD30D2B